MRLIPELTDSERQRFWKYVIKGDGCWKWSGQLDTRGYGTIKLRKRRTFAHRVSWMIHRGNPEYLYVLHHCDNPSCVNPIHLFLGTQTDNVADMMAKGRRWKTRDLPIGDQHWSRKHPDKVRRGELNNRAKLTSEVVRNMRRSFNSGVSRRMLSEQFHISLSQTYNITSGRQWRHV